MSSLLLWLFLVLATIYGSNQSDLNCSLVIEDTMSKYDFSVALCENSGGEKCALVNSYDMEDALGDISSAVDVVSDYNKHQITDSSTLEMIYKTFGCFKAPDAWTENLIKYWNNAITLQNIKEGQLLNISSPTPPCPLPTRSCTKYEKYLSYVSCPVPSQPLENDHKKLFEAYSKAMTSALPKHLAKNVTLSMMRFKAGMKYMLAPSIKKASSNIFVSIAKVCSKISLENQIAIIAKAHPRETFHDLDKRMKACRRFAVVTAFYYLLREVVPSKSLWKKAGLPFESGKLDNDPVRILSLVLRTSLEMVSASLEKPTINTTTTCYKKFSGDFYDIWITDYWPHLMKNLYSLRHDVGEVFLHTCIMINHFLKQYYFVHPRATLQDNFDFAELFSRMVKLTDLIFRNYYNDVGAFSAVWSILENIRTAGHQCKSHFYTLWYMAIFGNGYGIVRFFMEKIPSMPKKYHSYISIHKELENIMCIKSILLPEKVTDPKMPKNRLKKESGFKLLAHCPEASPLIDLFSSYKSSIDAAITAVASRDEQTKDSLIIEAIKMKLASNENQANTHAFSSVANLYFQLMSKEDETAILAKPPRETFPTMNRALIIHRLTVASMIHWWLKERLSSTANNISDGGNIVLIATYALLSALDFKHLKEKANYAGITLDCGKYMKGAVYSEWIENFWMKFRDEVYSQKLVEHEVVDNVHKMVIDILVHPYIPCPPENIDLIVPAANLEAVKEFSYFLIFHSFLSVPELPVSLTTFSNHLVKEFQDVSTAIDDISEQDLQCQLEFYKTWYFSMFVELFGFVRYMHSFPKDKYSKIDQQKTYLQFLKDNSKCNSKVF